MSRDTPPEVEKRLLALYASLTPAERVRMATEMFTTGVELVKVGIRQQQPDISEPELRRRVFLRLYSDCFSKEEAERIADYVASFKG